ncbi:hypothetical protein GCM10029964_108550 [Kibdelosporangium lantanae]
MTNLVSGVTSACFGVPFALLILASLTAHQAESVAALRKFLTDNFSFEVDMAEHWASTCAQWRFLDDYVKPRMYEQGLSWIRADAAARLNTILRDSTNPFLPFFQLREDMSDPGVLNERLIELRGQLPKAMRLREALAIARDEPFTIGLTPGWGLEI